DWSRIKDVGTFLLALNGAALSTFNWLQAVKKDRRQVSVSISTLVPTYSNGSLGEPYAQIKVVNKGHRQVTIESITLELPNNQRLHNFSSSDIIENQSTSLPVSLADGQVATKIFSYEGIAIAIGRYGNLSPVILKPVCVDSVGGAYYGDPWRVNPRELLTVSNTLSQNG